MTTLSTPNSKEVLQKALDAFLGAIGEDHASGILYKLQYEQLEGPQKFQADGSVISFPAPSSSLSFDDSILEPVKEAWKKIMGDAAAEAEYMTFADREGVMDDDDAYD